MLVRILGYNFTDDDESGMEKGNFIAATKIENYDIFLSMLEIMKGKDIVIDKEWYTFDGDYYLSFPKNDNEIMSLDIFVCEY